VLGLWMLGLFCHVVIDGAATRRRLQEAEKNHLSLQRINQALRLESEAYQEMARRDPLTGVLNRAGLGEALAQVAARDDERLFPLSLVFIDVDHFKSINDQHGHEVGDRVLGEVAAVVQTDIQRNDLFARWGGEEFLLICPQTLPADAQAIAERLRQRISTRRWPVGLSVTASFGVAEARAGEELADSIRRADEAMYRAKRNGRDRVELQLAEAL